MNVLEKLGAENCNDFETFELDEDYPNLIVDELDNGATFVHNILTGENFFNSKTIQELTGLSQSTVSDNIKKYYEFFPNTEIPVFGKKASNFNNETGITLKLKNTVRPVAFHNFNVLTYIAFHSEKPEAVVMREWIRNALNEKFNNYNDIDLVDMKAKNERLRNRLKNISLTEHMLTDEYTLALKNGHKEKADSISNTIRIQKDEFYKIDALVKEVDRWIRDEELRRPRLNDIKNNEFWSGGYDNCTVPPTGFKFDRECRFVMNANQSIVKRPWE